MFKDKSIAKTKELNHKTKGVVLVNVLVILSVLLIMGLALQSLLVTGIKFTRQAKLSLQALNLAEAGIDKAIFSLNKNPNYSGESNVPLGDGGFNIAISNTPEGNKIIEVESHIPNNSPYRIQRKIRVRAQPQPDVQSMSFAYAIQAGVGGFELENNAVIEGTVYSNGNIIGQNRIASKITGDAFAVNNISTLTVEKKSPEVGGNTHTIDEAHLINVTVLGTKYYDSPQAKPLPYVDTAYWQGKAEEGGTITQNPYIPPNGTSLGPKKIAGNFILTGGYTLTLQGTLWITGNLTLGNNSILNLSGSYGQYGGVIIVDGRVDVQSGVHVNDDDPLYGGTGKPLLVVSKSNSLDPSDPAVDIGNTVIAIVFHAKDGMIKISNNADIQAAAAYKILVKENAEIHYKEGLADAQFSAGPGGSWTVMPGSWERIY